MRISHILILSVQPVLLRIKNTRLSFIVQQTTTSQKIAKLWSPGGAMQKIITLIRAHGLLNRAHGLVNRAHELVIHAHDLVNRAHDLVIHAHRLA